MNTQVRESNSLGTVAFVCGLVALVMSFIPIIGMVAWILAPIALLCGLIALRHKPRSMAIAGIILSVIAMVICVLWVGALAA